MSQQQPKPRQRRHHERSRNGCLTCRARHVRCDEARPECDKCKAGKRPCHYSQPNLPRSDQRWFMNQAPGVSVWHVQSDTADPFHSMAIEMPFRSHELLKYFLEADTVPNFGTECAVDQNIWNHPVFAEMPLVVPKDEWITRARNDPATLRCTLLLGSMHYVWKVGEFKDFGKSFFFHKMELIRHTNTLLSGDVLKITPQSLKLIAILSVIESCVGNFPLAEAHLDGLLTVLEMREKRISAEGRDPAEEEDEILERLLLTAHHFIGAVRSRIKQTYRGEADADNIWHTSFSGLPENLAGIRIFPYYLLSDPLELNVPMDVHACVETMKQMTIAVNRRSRICSVDKAHHVVDESLASGMSICDNANSAVCRGCQGMTSFLFAWSNINAHSLRQEHNVGKRAPVMSSWRGLCAVSSLYLNHVLGLWNGGEPIEPHMFRRIIVTILRDIQSMGTSEEALTGRQGDLWLWKVMTTAYAVATTLPMDGPRFTGDSAVMMDGAVILGWLQSRIGIWSKVQGVTQWEQAQKALSRVCWPNPVSEAKEAALTYIWARAVNEREGTVMSDS
ncbi:hypothetical protein B0I35DRAFT_263941 [Stachybotrys elegans]|uniref:Zn(2)-C6 fungal-type domain-containing protein n=1 Tax=Stachybotrys elegans TaxID=80388 RepID=A0A8K0SKI4_9HYPO|nr:hypothetical protein B0I35DRAFT_263941 [Stachybotrys elegans]